MTLKIKKDDGPRQTKSSIQLFDSVASRGRHRRRYAWSQVCTKLSACEQMHLMRYDLMPGSLIGTWGCLRTGERAETLTISKQVAGK